MTAIGFNSHLSGEDCVHEKYLMNPTRLCDTIAYELRKLHETDYTGCPIMDRTTEYLAVAERSIILGIMINLISLIVLDIAQQRKLMPFWLLRRRPCKARFYFTVIIVCLILSLTTGNSQGLSMSAAAVLATDILIYFGGLDTLV